MENHGKPRKTRERKLSRNRLFSWSSLMSLLLIPCLLAETATTAVSRPGFRVPGPATCRLTRDAGLWTRDFPFAAQALAVRPVFDLFSRVKEGFRIRRAFPRTLGTILIALDFWVIIRGGPVEQYLRWGHGIPFAMAIFGVVILAVYLTLEELSKHQYQGLAPNHRMRMINERTADLLQKEGLLAPNPSAIEEFAPIVNLLNDEVKYRASLYGTRVDFSLNLASMNIADRYLNVTGDLWILLQKNLPLADHYSAELKLVFPSGPTAMFRLAAVALRIHKSLMENQPFSESDVKELQELKLAAYGAPLDGLASLFLISERTRPFGIELLRWIMRQRKSSSSRDFLSRLRAIDPALADSLDSSLARKTAPVAEPQTLNELYDPHNPLRPSFDVKISGTSLNYDEPDSDPFSVTFWRTASVIRDWLMQEGISESLLVHALLTMERAKRRVRFHDQLQRLHIPEYIKDGALFSITPIPQRALYVRIDSEFFVSMLRDSHRDDLLTIAVGHELGHLAEANGYIRLRRGAKDPQVPSAIKDWMANGLVPNYRHDIVADVFARALAGESAFQHDVLQLVAHALDNEDEKLEPLDDLDRLAYYLALVDSLQDREVAARIRTSVESRCGQLIGVANLSADVWQGFREYYTQVLQSYIVGKKAIRQSPSVKGANPTTPTGGSGLRIGGRLFSVLKSIRYRAQGGSQRSAVNRWKQMSA